MPRPNQARSIASETALAARIAHERKARGLGVDALAKLMTEAGCPIAGSAIYRIESGDPPRRITFDEAVAIASVFGLSLEDLSTPLELVRQTKARDLIAKLDPAIGALSEAVEGVLNLYVELFEITLHDHELSEYVMNHWFSPGQAEGGRSLIVTGKGNEVASAEFENALQDFYTAIVNAAGNAVAADAGIGPVQDVDTAGNVVDSDGKEGNDGKHHEEV